MGFTHGYEFWADGIGRIVFYFTIYIMLATFSLRLNIDGTIMKWLVLPVFL